MSDGYIISPGKYVTAQVGLPRVFYDKRWVYPHMRSTFARLKTDLCLDIPDLRGIPRYRSLGNFLPIAITNYSNKHFRIREEDTIAVADHERLVAEPNATEMTLHFGNQHLVLVEEKLPQLPGTELRYIDPHAENLWEHTCLVEFQRLFAQRNECHVVTTQEHIEIPEGMIGIFDDEIARQHGLKHSTAIFAYPYKTPGKRVIALEFRTTQSFIFEPGMAAMTLRLYRADFYRNGDRPRYETQDTIVPNGRK